MFLIKKWYELFYFIFILYEVCKFCNPAEMIYDFYFLASTNLFSFGVYLAIARK